MKKTARYNLVGLKGVRCYVEANSAEEAEKLFSDKVLKTKRPDWQVESVKDTTPVLERMMEGINKK